MSVSSKFLYDLYIDVFGQYVCVSICFAISLIGTAALFLGGLYDKSIRKRYFGCASAAFLITILLGCVLPINLYSQLKDNYKIFKTSEVEYLELDPELHTAVCDISKNVDMYRSYVVYYEDFARDIVSVNTDTGLLISLWFRGALPDSRTHLEEGDSIQYYNMRVKEEYKDFLGQDVVDYISKESLVYSINGQPLYHPSTLNANQKKAYDVFFGKIIGPDKSATPQEKQPQQQAQSQQTQTQQNQQEQQTQSKIEELHLVKPMTEEDILTSWGKAVRVLTEESGVEEFELNKTLTLVKDTKSYIVKQGGTVTELHYILKDSKEAEPKSTQVTVNNNVSVNTPTEAQQ